MKHTMINVNLQGKSKDKIQELVSLKTNSKEIKTIEPKARVYWLSVGGRINPVTKELPK